ncbi:MAG TPA: 4-(cytidine 5'-diphospho)-2-C-methyl-D-erythritol kinase [Usitatibacter sp.]|jgi:4-diphosphocytidyl-2-C-methyl-D-erythritol kinase|nr:4-(cytidine 5'-diphospho)-2-C-methyl-D-erythritol kinase [Usitatibacter sp.]
MQTGTGFPAPAKLNLFLHVIGRRPDGYHMLQSVFTLIDRCDEVRLRVRDDGQVRRTAELPGVPESEDLAVRAALLLKEASGSPKGVDIEIEKRIPLGAGLGGGSSDAATVLLALDRLWETGFGADALAELGAALGADVPFFIHGSSAWVEGVGERITPIELPCLWYLVLTPPVAVPTGVVFAAPELTRNTEPLKMEDFSAQPLESVGPRFRNDLEPVVTARYPIVREHLEWLRRHADARMTGSGSCVFASFATREEAQSVLDRLPAPMQGFVAQGIGHHPLRAQ